MALPAQSLLQSAPAALVKADRSEPPIQHLPILQSGLVILFRSAMDIPISTAILLPANSAARTLSRPQHARNPSSCEQRPDRRRRWKAWLDRRSTLLVRAADTRDTAIRPPWPGRNAAAGSVHSGIPGNLRRRALCSANGSWRTFPLSYTLRWLEFAIRVRPLVSL